jgi:beta-lactam-binding protein with PASTA domain
VLPTSRAEDGNPGSATATGAAVAPLPAAGQPEDDDREPSRAGLYFLLGFLLVALIGGAAYLLPRLFEEPPAEDVRVPNLIGLSEQQALNAIAEAELERGDVNYEPSDDTDRDRVIEQEPNRDEFVAEGTPVDIVVSTGAPMVTVPSVVGQDLDTARSNLEGAGLRVTERERDSDEPQGQVLETNPAAGESVPEGTPVTVFFSDGPEEVPDVVGRQRREAERILREAGFEVFVTTTTDTTEPRGTVVRQNPPAGSTAEEGTSITIEVSAFEEEEPTPTPTPTTPTEVPTVTPSVTPTPLESPD